MKAIDISNYQAHGLDFNVLRDNEVEAGWARLGYRGYLYANINKDAGFDSNIAAIKEAGMAAMLYFVSQAVNEDEVREEARFCIDQANANDIQHIAYDSENGDEEDGTGRADAGKLSKEDRTYFLNCFIDECCNAGKIPWLYCNKYWLFNNFNVNDIDVRVRYWIAGYVDNCPDIGREVHMWQFTNAFAGYHLDCSEVYIDLNNNGSEESEDRSMRRDRADLYVRTTYAEVMGRDADPSGLEAYVAAIIDRDENDDLTDVDNALRASDEYKRNMIIRFYNVFLGRDPESEEVIQGKMGYPRLRDIVDDIIHSEEYQNR